MYTRTRTSWSDIHRKWTLVGQNAHWDGWSGSRTYKIGKETNDTVTPKYFSKRRKGEILPVNPFSSYSYHFESSPGDIGTDILWYNGTVGSGPGVSGHYASYFHPRPLPSGGDANGLESHAILAQEALGDINSLTWDLGTFLAELGSTKALLTRAMSRTLSRADAIVKNGAKSWKEFADMWLEARYGWRPLMYDLQAISEISQRFSEKRSPYVRKTRVSTSSDTKSGHSHQGVMWTDSGSVSSIYINHRVDYNTVWKYSRRAVVGARLRGSTDILLDPVVTAWEIVPFSFIVDWFVNVGDLLAAHSPVASTDVTAVSLADFVERIDTTTVRPDFKSTKGRYRKWWETTNLRGVSTAHSKAVWKVREPKAGVDVDLSFRLNFDWAKAIDLAAILGARLKLLRSLR